MDASGIIRELQREVDDLEKKNMEVVKTENFKRYVSYLEEVVTENAKISEHDFQRQMEKYRAEHANGIKYSEFQHEASMEMFRSVITTGQSALRASMILCGGGALAMLTFIGNALSKFADMNTLIVNLNYTLFLFTWGAMFAAIAAGGTYLCQSAYHNYVDSQFEDKRSLVVGNVLSGVVFCLVIGSYLFFFFGMDNAYQSFKAV